MRVNSTSATWSWAEINIISSIIMNVLECAFCPDFYANLELRSDPSVSATNMELPFPLWHDEKVTGYLRIYPSVNDQQLEEFHGRFS
jgi:hypothetical protein